MPSQNQTLTTLCCLRLILYHHKKYVFLNWAVGAQLE